MGIMEKVLNHFSLEEIGELNKESEAEYAQKACDRYNAMEGTLTGYNCLKCHNKGHIQVYEDGRYICKMCDCAPKRQTMKRLERSGLKDVISRCTFKTFEAGEQWQMDAKEICMQYAEKKRGWLIISGNPGTGKSHLCYAVCGQLMKDGVDVLYSMWRADSQKLKALAGTSDYEKEIAPFKTVRCLYIDDLFKGKSVSDADINLAFDIINSRYNNTELLTIISSELSMDKLLDIDQAIGSRIYERRFAYLDFSNHRNRRLV